MQELAHITNGNEPACWRNGRTFVFWSHECRQPWQTQAWIESQRRTLRPAEFSRMILTQFAEGQGNFCEPDAWLACIDPEHQILMPTKAHQIHLGLDLALSPGGDDCAAVACYGEGGLVKVAFHKVWRGGKDRKVPLKLGESVKPWILRVAELYDLAAVAFDPWQAQYLADELRAAGIRMVEVPQTHSSRGGRDTALHDLVSDRRLVLYDHADLRAAAQFANARELGDGRIFIQKASRGKIDLLVAMSNCASEALASASSWWLF